MGEASVAVRRVVATGIVASTIYSAGCSFTRSVHEAGLALGAREGSCRAGGGGDSAEP